MNKYTRMISRRIFSLLFIAGLFILLSVPKPTVAASSSFNKLINYQGKLTDSSSVSISDGSYNMTFRLYTTATAGAPLWQEEWTSTSTQVVVTGGLFSVLLGSNLALTSVDFNQGLYLGVEIGSTTTTPVWDGEMTPRKRLGAVPAAFEADKLDGLDSSQFVRSDDSGTIASSSASTLLALTQSGAGNIFSLANSAGAVFTVTNSGNIGIGTTSPYAALSIVGSTGVVAGKYHATNTNATSTFAGEAVFSGRVGIGTTSPYTAHALMVAGNGGTQLDIDGDSGTGATVGINITSNTSRSWQVGVKGTNESGAFIIYDSTAGVRRLTIDSIGNFGIGTTSPYAKLSVVGEVVASHFTGTTSASSTFGGPLSVAGTATSTWTGNGVNITGGGCFAISGTCVGSISGSGSAGRLTFWNGASSITSTSTFIWDDNTGRLGIGTSSPSRMISVVGGSGFFGLGDAVSSSTLVRASNISTLGGYTFSASQGRYVYLHSSTVLATLFIGPNASTTLVSSITTATAGGGRIKIDGQYLYVSHDTGSTGSVDIFDISRPSKPELVGVVEPATRIGGFAVAGGFLYISPLDQTLRAYDVSNPNAPVLLKIYTTPGVGANLSRLTVNGRYIFARAGNNNVMILDIADPTNIKLVSNFSTTAGAQSLEVNGRYLHVGTVQNASVNEYQIYDLIDPYAPALMGGVEFGKDVETVRVSGRYAYIGIDTNSAGPEIFVYDIADPLAPVAVASNEVGNHVYGIELIGRYIVASTNSGSGLIIYENSSVESASVLAHYLEAGRASVIRDLVVGGQAFLNTSLNVGMGGIGSLGAGAFRVFSTSSIAVLPAIGGSVTDGSNNTVANVLNLAHYATTSVGVRAGIGAGLTFSAQNNATTSTTTASVAGILTDTSTTSPAGALTFSTKGSSIGLSERMRITSTGLVGIGTTSPYAALSVVGSTGVVADKYFATSTIATSTFMSTLAIATTTPLSNAIFVVATSSGTALVINRSNGYVGVGTTTPTGQFSVNGSVFLKNISISAAGDSAICSTLGGEIRLALGQTDCIMSSARYKESISDLDQGLDIIRRLRPVSYNYIGLEGRHVGFIAEEVDKIDPRLVARDPEGIIRSVRYSETVAILARAIQELDTKLATSLNSNLSAFSSNSLSILALAGKGISEVSYLNDVNSNWSISSDGLLRTREVRTQRLCVGSVCINELDLRALLIKNDIYINGPEENGLPAPVVDISPTQTPTSTPVEEIIPTSTTTPTTTPTTVITPQQSLTPTSTPVALPQVPLLSPTSTPTTTNQQ